MKIGIDGQKLLIDQLAGPEVYTYETVKGFAQVDKENEYVVYFDRKPSKDFWNDLSAGNKKFNYNMLSTYLYYHIKLFFIYVMNNRNNFDDFDNPFNHFYQLNNGRSLSMNDDKYVLM